MLRKTHKYNNRSEGKMEEKKGRKNPIEPIWIIRWDEPYGMECRSGKLEDAEAYAKEKAEETGNTYIIL